MKGMKRLFIIAVIAMSMASCYRVSPDAGVESVLVKKPWFFGHGGVESEPIAAGSTWCAVTTDHKEFNVTPITITENFQKMMPSDNTPVDFAAYLKVQVISGSTPRLYEKFGPDWYSHNIQATFRTLVRDKASRYKMLELASKREISATMEKEIFAEITAYVKSLNIPITIMQVSIGSITPPQEVLNETKNTAAQNQSILTQTSRANAETARKQAEINKAEADKAYKVEMGMTTQEYLTLRQIEINKEQIELIKDNPNIHVIFGNASTVLPLK
jgi:regulator of protease activity HflC (stomatin/prohibitin superfamily)